MTTTTTTTTHPNQHNTDAELENTPPLVCFPVWRLSCANKRCRAQDNTLVGVISCSVSFVGTPTHTEHKMTPSSVSFRAWILSYPLKWRSRDVYYIFYILLNSNYIYMFKYIFIPWEFSGNPTPVITGQEFGRYRCGTDKNSPRDTCIYWLKVRLVNRKITKTRPNSNWK